MLALWLLLAAPAKAASPAPTSFTFAPWNGASFAVNEGGGQLQTSLSGPLAESLVTVGMNTAVPISLSAGDANGAYQVQGTIGVSTATAQRMEAYRHVEDFLAGPEDGNLILALMPVLCPPGAPDGHQCDAVSIARWYRGLPRADRAAIVHAAEELGKAEIKRVDVEDEAFKAGTPPATAGSRALTAEALAADRLAAQSVVDFAATFTTLAERLDRAELESGDDSSGTKASPLDQLASGKVKDTIVEANLEVKGGWQRFDAFGSVSATAAEPFADSTASGGLNLRVYFPKVFAAGLSVNGGAAWTYTRTADTTDPDRTLVAGAPALEGRVSGSVYVVFAFPAAITVPLGGPKPTAYYPLLELTGNVATTMAPSSTVDWSAQAVLGGRPTTAGPGLGVGVSLGPSSVGLTVLPMFYASGELPDLTAKKAAAGAD